MIHTKYHLCGRELDILNILWKSPKPLIASEIVTISGDMTINTVQGMLKKLLNKKLIKIADISYNHKSICRCYEAAISAEDYEAQRVFHTVKSSALDNFSTAGFIRAFLKQETDTEAALRDIEELEKMISEEKKKLTEK